MSTRMKIVGAFTLWMVTGSLGTLQAQAPTVDQRVTRLEETMEVIRDYNDDFLSLVVWSLTTVATVVVVLLGFNWFQGQRSLRREVESVRSELRAFLESRVTEAEAPLREKLDEALEGLKKKLKTLSSESVSPIAGRVNSLDNRLRDLEFESLKGQYEKWLTAGVLANATRKAIEIVRVAMGFGHEYWVSEALDRLSETLSKVESKGDRLESDILSDLERTLSQLSSDFSASRTAIKEKALRIHSL